MVFWPWYPRPPKTTWPINHYGIPLGDAVYAAELKGPRKLLRIWPAIFDFESDLGRKRSQAKPKIPGRVPTDRHTTIPNVSGPIWACFDDDPKPSKCEIAQPGLWELLVQGFRAEAEG